MTGTLESLGRFGSLGLAGARGPYALLWAEALLVLVAAGAGLLLAPRRPVVSGAARRLFRAVARRKPLAVALVFVATLLSELLLLPLTGIPEPQVHDEFGYLLAARTFAAGRLTNPSPPEWEHFETFHVLLRPTHMSMHPPAQGLVLAAGQKLFDLPVAGVWLTLAAACAAVCWMLQAWVPPSWALLGGLLAALRVGVFSYWATSYWGGGVGLLGGALVLGAAPRILARARSRDALLLAGGVSVLANARPFEGLVLSAPVAIALLLWVVRPSPLPRGRRILRVVLPATALLAATAAAMAVYNQAVTGDPLKRPYELHREVYATGRHFIWQPPLPPPSYTHPVMRDFYTGWELSGFQGSRSAADLLSRTGEKLRNLWLFFVGPLLTPAFLFLPVALTRRKLRLPALVLAASFTGFLVVAWWLMSHYVAPVYPVLLLFLVDGLRRLAAVRSRRRALGRGLLAGLGAAALLVAALRCAAGPLGLQLAWWPPTWYTLVRYANFPRADFLRWLEAQPGKQLVLVRYGPQHSPHLEWVYNEPDLGSARVVWAREMGEERDRALAGAFGERTVWRLFADEVPPRLERLGGAERAGDGLK